MDTPRNGLMSGKELLAMDIAPINWLIKDLLPEGLAILAGRPKTGKSWLALNLALSIVKGQKALSSFDVMQAGVFYIPYEDGPRRLQDRINKMDKSLSSNMDSISQLFFPENLEFPPLENGGFKLLKEYLEKYEDIKLVIIDTLARAMQSSKNSFGKNEYQAANDLIGNLQRIAIDYNITILIVHHTTKKEPENPLDAVMGTTGIVAPVDTVMVLRKPPKTDNLILHLISRDIISKDLTIKMNQDTFNFEIIEAEDEQNAITMERREILRLFENEHTKVLRTSEIAKLLGKGRPNISKMLGKMKKDGLLIEASYGCYKLPELIE